MQNRQRTHEILPRGGGFRFCIAAGGVPGYGRRGPMSRVLLPALVVALHAACGPTQQSAPAAAASAAPAASAANADALRSWNDGAAKRAIVDFVARVTKEGGAEFVAVPERIAVFDNDGTLWSEK